MTDEQEVVEAPAEPTIFVLHEAGHKIEVGEHEWSFVQNSGGRERLVVGKDGTRYHHVGAVPVLDENGEPKKDKFGVPLVDWTYREDP